MLYCSSVRPSGVRPSPLCFISLTLVFLTDFYRLCMGIDIGDEWVRIVYRPILFIIVNNRVMALA